MIEDQLKQLCIALDANTGVLMELKALKTAKNQAPAAQAPAAQAPAAQAPAAQAPAAQAPAAQAPTAQAPTAQAPAAQAVVGTEVDNDGIAWDARIHAATKTKTQGGTWKQLRQPKLTFPNKEVWEKYVLDVKAELLGGVDATKPEAIVDGVTIPPGVHNSDNMTQEYAAVKKNINVPVMFPAAQGVAYDSYKESGWSDDQLIESGFMAAPAAGITNTTIDDIRVAMQELSTTKGAAYIVECIASYGRTLDEIDPSNYDMLMAKMEACPDLTVPAPPKA